MPSRRQALGHGAGLAGLLVGTGLFPQFALAYSRQAFDARTLQDALAALGAGALSESSDVLLAGPDIAENGAIVAFAFSTALPGVRRLLLLVEKNPVPLVALFNVSPSIEPAFSIRAKLAQSSGVYAVAVMDDGRALYARKDVKVTLGSCGT
ncbi:MAG: thiosulfate oxidation carrier protein SoxY [Burkholderiales bacterium]|nr:thiosulfate oxidation carrier protein SoxY [Burkholderiales bacterium]